MNLKLIDEKIFALTEAEKENLFNQQTEKFDYLNQEINGYKFHVISSLKELKALADKMKNGAFYCRNVILKGEYLILTIDNGDDKDFTNFGIKIEDSITDSLVFDTGVNLKLYVNMPSPQHVRDVFNQFAQKNNIINEQ